MSNTNFAGVVAFDSEGGIGNNNKLPWHIPADLKFFKNLTMGHTIVMGRKTFESIGKPLPNRHTIVLTSDKSYKIKDKNVSVLYSVKDVLNLDFKGTVFICGGASVYKAFLPYMNELYVTHVKGTYETDKTFPFKVEDYFRVVAVIIDTENIKISKYFKK